MDRGMNVSINWLKGLVRTLFRRNTPIPSNSDERPSYLLAEGGVEGFSASVQRWREDQKRAGS